MARGVIFDIDGTLAERLRADVRIVAVRSDGWNDESLNGATAIYDDVSHLLGEYGTSIFSRG